jgi:hypothetical protein
MAKDIFDAPTGEENQNNSDALAELVGEDKKFKTVELLAEGKKQSDAHIAQLEGEAELLRKELADKDSATDDKATVAELIKAVRDSQKEGDAEGNQSLSDDDLSKKIKTIMQGETDAQTRAKNRDAANQSVLDKVEGNAEAARAYLEGRAKQLGMTVAGLTELGEVSPAAFTELMDTGTNKSSRDTNISSLPNNQLPTDTVLTKDGHRTKAYYDKLKAEIGPQKFWNDSKLQGERFKDAMALGDDF